MSIDKDKIKHVSKLARISVNDKKIDDLMGTEKWKEKIQN